MPSRRPAIGNPAPLRLSRCRVFGQCSNIWTYGQFRNLSDDRQYEKASGFIAVLKYPVLFPAASRIAYPVGTATRYFRGTAAPLPREIWKYPEIFADCIDDTAAGYRNRLAICAIGRRSQHPDLMPLPLLHPHRDIKAFDRVCQGSPRLLPRLHMELSGR